MCTLEIPREGVASFVLLIAGLGYDIQGHQNPKGAPENRGSKDRATNLVPNPVSRRLGRFEEGSILHKPPRGYPLWSRQTATKACRGLLLRQAGLRG